MISPIGQSRGLTTAVLVVLLLPFVSEAGEEKGGFVPAAVCGSCHHETYESWSRTFHALAAIDPVFLEALKRTESQWGPSTGEDCLSCHSPARTPGSGPFLGDPLAREGVTCSFCHSVTAVDQSRYLRRFTNDPGRLVVSPDGHDVESHHFENHELMMGSRFCAGCHEWVNAQGLKVLSTWSEWKESFYAGEQISCQQCHMPKSPGSTSTHEGAKSVRATNLHFQMGGHSQDQLVAAARLDLEVKVAPEGILLDIDVTNFNAGHKLPTGIPTRKMNLLVEFYDREGRLLHGERKVYGRIIADGDGNILEDVAEQFVKGAREISDNRIAPKEVRHEKFTFAPPEGVDFVLAEATLEYEILTPYLIPPVVTFDITRRRIPLDLGSEGGAGLKSTAIPLGIIVALFIVVTVFSALLFYGKTGRGSRNRERKE